MTAGRLPRQRPFWVAILAALALVTFGAVPHTGSSGPSGMSSTSGVAVAKAPTLNDVAATVRAGDHTPSSLTSPAIDLGVGGPVLTLLVLFAGAFFAPVRTRRPLFAAAAARAPPVVV